LGTDVGAEGAFEEDTVAPVADVAPVEDADEADAATVDPEFVAARVGKLVVGGRWLNWKFG
jgi:hypothetical protein